jgi:hypothetical protein
MISPHNWEQIGDAAGQLYAGEGVLLATNPGTGDVNQYLGSPGQWKRIGGPGRTFAFCSGVYGLRPNGSGVYRYTGQDTNWIQIGGAANWIYGGVAGFFATAPNNGDINRYLGTPGKWTKAGGPGAHFAVGDRLYGLTSNHDHINRWEGGTTWLTVGQNPTAWIYAGVISLLATDPGTGNVYRFIDSDLAWSYMGGPGADFQIDSSGRVYSLTPDKGAVNMWQGDSSWVNVGGAAAQIVAA